MIDTDFKNYLRATRFLWDGNLLSHKITDKQILKAYVAGSAYAKKYKVVRKDKGVLKKRKAK